MAFTSVLGMALKACSPACSRACSRTGSPPRRSSRSARRSASSSSTEMMAFSPGLPVTPADLEATGAVRTTEHYRQLIRDVIQETANQGEVVIFAHAAAMALGASGEVLRVLITASPETRAERVAAAYALSPRDADKAIRESDKARRDYLKDFYGIGEELPTHYDLVINTDVLSPQRAVDAILGAARG
jgi:cytidylate kinase